MSSNNKKIIVVVGATGNQGSSVANTFLKLPTWHVRCLTRNTSSTAAQTLASQGAEVVKADLSDISSLSKAFENANAIFVNTDFWAQYRDPKSQTKGISEQSYELEVSYGKNAAIAAAGVKSLERFVYSALGPMKKASNGKYPHSYHWESKNAIVDFIENEQPELAKKTSFIYLGAYATNAFLAPKLDPSTGKYTLIIPMKKDTKMPIIDAAKSTGPFVQALIETEEPGKKLLAYDSDLSIGEIVDIWSKVTGKETVLNEVTVDFMHMQFGVPLEVLGGPAFIEEFGYMAGLTGVIEPHQLKKKVVTASFEQFLKGRDHDELLGDAKAQMDGIKK
ncbi:putative hscarg dehydrogenase [Cadophora sp. DSE1049]|nr:putative hscarg dehydrogenase [Cadophora sp. DSE1049]